MTQAMRRWKCRDCSRANETEIGLDGTALCGHCGHRINVQLSRIKNGTILPSVYPTRLGVQRAVHRARSLGEV